MPLSSSSKTCLLRKKGRTKEISAVSQLGLSQDVARSFPLPFTHKDSSRLDQNLLRLEQTTSDSRNHSSTGSLEDEQGVLGGFDEAYERSDGSDHFASEAIRHWAWSKGKMEVWKGWRGREGGRVRRRGGRKNGGGG